MFFSSNYIHNFLNLHNINNSRLINWIYKYILFMDIAMNTQSKEQTKCIDVFEYYMKLVALNTKTPPNTGGFI